MNAQKPREEILVFDFEFYPRVVNETQINFDENEISLLNKGLKYNFSKKNKRGIFDELIAAEAALKFIPNIDERNSLRAIVNSKMQSIQKKGVPSRNNRFSQEQRIVNSIRKKLSLNKAIITKADKGNCIVVLYHDDYVKKVNNFIESNNVIELDKDPTSKYISTINKAVNSIKALFPPEEVRYLKMMNPRPLL